MSNIQISFIIPCFNAMHYIDECIYSIVEQNVDFPIEVLCIDDGSTDGTNKHIEELQKDIPFLNLHINEKNAGVSFSRNKGIELARGKYIWFVDSDDLVTPNAIEYFYKNAEENCADIIVGRYIKFFDNDNQQALSDCKSVFYNNSATIQCGGNLITIPIHEQECSAFIMPMMFKKDFLIKNRLSFNRKICFGEDQLLHLQLECIERSVVRTDFPVYLYRINKFSVTNKRSSSRRIKVYISLKEIHKEYSYILNKNLHPDKGKMERLTTDMHKSMISALCGVTDSKMVLNEMKELKKSHLYPYKKSLTSINLKQIIKEIELYSKLFFYMKHYLHRFYYKIMGLDKKEKSI